MQNKLVKIRGYTFTNYPESQLKQLGFPLSPIQSLEQQGLEVQSLFLQTSDQSLVQIEFAILKDEDAFSKSNLAKPEHLKESIFPKIFESDLTAETTAQIEEIKLQNNPTLQSLIWLDRSYNSVDHILIPGVRNEDLSDSDDLYQYFKIRKETELCALVLNCDNLDSIAAKITPTEWIEWKGQKALHLKEGPHLFDFIFI